MLLPAARDCPCALLLRSHGDEALPRLPLSASLQPGLPTPTSVLLQVFAPTHAHAHPHPSMGVLLRRCHALGSRCTPMDSLLPVLAWLSEESAEAVPAPGTGPRLPLLSPAPGSRPRPRDLQSRMTGGAKTLGADESRVRNMGNCNKLR